MDVLGIITFILRIANARTILESLLRRGMSNNTSVIYPLDLVICGNGKQNLSSKRECTFFMVWGPATEILSGIRLPRFPLTHSPWEFYNRSGSSAVGDDARCEKKRTKYIVLFHGSAPFWDDFIPRSRLVQTVCIIQDYTANYPGVKQTDALCVKYRYTFCLLIHMQLEEAREALQIRFVSSCSVPSKQGFCF